MAVDEARSSRGPKGPSGKPEGTDVPPPQPARLKVTETMERPKPAEDWVGDSLRKLYASTLDEDIPQDMLALLDQLDRRATPGSDDDAPPEGGGS